MDLKMHHNGCAWQRTLVLELPQLMLEAIPMRRTFVIIHVEIGAFRAKTETRYGDRDISTHRAGLASLKHPCCC